MKICYIVKWRGREWWRGDEWWMSGGEGVVVEERVSGEGGSEWWGGSGGGGSEW